MSERTPAQREQDKEWVDKKIKWEATDEGKVLAFLKENPLSTADEVFKATGCGVTRRKFIRQKKYNGQIVWRVNWPKYNAWLRGEIP